MPPRPASAGKPDPTPSEEPVEEIHPIRLARMLAEKWSDLSASAREVCLAELTEGGVIEPAGAKASPLEQFVKVPAGSEDKAELKMDVLRTQLKMHDNRYAGPLDLLDVLGLLVELAGHVGMLGDMLATVWPAWQGLSRSSRLHASAASRVPLANHLRDALDGRPGGDLSSALKDQQTAARLLIAILTGLGQGGQSFARECSQFIDPETIHRELRKSRGRPPTVDEMWARYKQLANSLTPGEIEHRLLQHIVNAAEAFFHAVNRG